MRVSCLQENLAKGLSIVGRSVSTRTTLPILSNVLLATDNGRLKLSATNLELSINCWLAAKVEEEGAITIPARLLTEFVNSLPPERIDLILDESTQTLNTRCANFEANLKGIDAQEFPGVPGLGSGSEIIRLDPVALKQSINQVTFAAATDESRPVLTGVLAQFGPHHLTMDAADGFRLSRKTLPLTHSIDEKFEVIIPARALSELARIMGEQDEPIQVAITPSRNQILFHLKDIDLVSQLHEGRFPDLAQIIPKTYATRAILETRSFLKAVRVSHLFARDAANIVKLDVAPGDGGLLGGRITLAATSQDLGDNVSALEASVYGEAVEIAFNAKYLMDVLNVMEGAQVAVETTSPASPGVVRAVGDETFTHVIMPMHLNK